MVFNLFLMGNENVSSEGNDGSHLKRKWRGARGGGGTVQSWKNMKRRKSRGNTSACKRVRSLSDCRRNVSNQCNLYPPPPNPAQSSAANNFAAPHPPFPTHPNVFFCPLKKYLYIHQFSRSITSSFTGN